ncbi:MAG: FmdB family zinc ribbon protein, partial [Steroidobacteraceae bacterium]
FALKLRHWPPLRYTSAGATKRKHMPFYEYQCNNCGHTLEAMQKLHDSPLKKCPHCGKSQLQRLMSAPVFRLKGGGWYETDFKSDQDAKRNLADRPEAQAPKEEKKETAEAPSKDAATSDTAKPAEKTADKPAEKAAPAKAAAAEPSPKTASRRAHASAPNKSKVKAASKRPVRPAAKRTAAKPARRR